MYAIVENNMTVNPSQLLDAIHHLAPICNVACVVMGAMAANVLRPSTEWDRCKIFMQKMFPDKADAYYERSSFLLLTAIGVGLAYATMNPQNSITCMMSGFSWSGSLGLLTSKVGS